MTQKTEPNKVQLPDPQYSGGLSVEESMLKRRSIREYKNEPLALSELSQLLWAAQGITDEEGKRTAPSAGALYPLEVYVAVGNVTELPSGVYKYNPHEHELLIIAEGDIRDELSDVALGQASVGNGAVVIVFAGVFERTAVKYGERSERYVYMEAGHAAQNVYLQATSLNLGTVVAGAFDDDDVQKILNMQANEQPLYLMPVGRI